MTSYLPPRRTLPRSSLVQLFRRRASTPETTKPGEESAKDRTLPPSTSRGMPQRARRDRVCMQTQTSQRRSHRWCLHRQARLASRPPLHGAPQKARTPQLPSMRTQWWLRQGRRRSFHCRQHSRPRQPSRRPPRRWRCPISCRRTQLARRQRAHWLLGRWRLLRQRQQFRKRQVSRRRLSCPLSKPPKHCPSRRQPQVVLMHRMSRYRMEGLRWRSPK